jgi:hypothetical protein
MHTLTDYEIPQYDPKKPTKNEDIVTIKIYKSLEGGIGEYRLERRGIQGMGGGR